MPIYQRGDAYLVSVGSKGNSHRQGDWGCRMSADRELLELAAKAAGYAEWDWLSADHWMNVYDEQGRQSSWNPLTDDGDALRLAVKLGIDPEWGGFDVEVCKQHSGARNFCYVEPHDSDPYAATRRAIVRAAAQIGRHS